MISINELIEIEILTLGVDFQETKLIHPKEYEYTV